MGLSPSRNPLVRVAQDTLRRARVDNNPVQLLPQPDASSSGQVGSNASSGTYDWVAPGLIGITPLEDFTIG